MFDSTESVIELEIGRLEAMRNYDVDKLDRILHDSFSFTHMNGLFETKDGFLSRLQNRAALYHPATLSEIQCTIFAGVAILTGRVDVKVEVPSTDAIFDMHNRFISVWIEEDHQWKAAAYQSTPLPE